MTNAKTHPLLTREQARALLDQRGESVAGFARRQGLPECAVYKVLYGINKGRRGNSHCAAVALGMKREPQPTRAPAGAL